MEALRELWHSMDPSLISDFLVRILAVLLCLSVHESSHALAAYALGDETARRSRRISLNPLRHIDWFGLAALFLCGFGWAKPVTVNARYFRRPKLGMALTALAGPISNFLLAFVLLGVAGSFTEMEAFLLQFCVQAAYMSIALGIFNLIPIPPLDGSKVLFSVLPNRAYGWLMRYERYGFVLCWVFIGVCGRWITAAANAVFAAMLQVIL